MKHVCINCYFVIESIRLTAVMVIVKVAIILFVIITGSLYADTNNWRDFTPYP